MNNKLILFGAFLLFAQAGSAQKTDKIALINIGNIGTERAAVRATRDFWNRVGESKEERWYKLPNGYLAEYAEGAVNTRYMYDPKGVLLYSLLTYTEKEMPAEVRKLVLSNYYDYKIGWVKEINEDENHVYVVHLEDSVSWKELSVQDGEYRETKSYRKMGY